MADLSEDVLAMMTQRRAALGKTLQEAERNVVNANAALNYVRGAFAEIDKSIEIFAIAERDINQTKPNGKQPAPAVQVEGHANA